jgi:hypothetical protein
MAAISAITNSAASSTPKAASEESILASLARFESTWCSEANLDDFDFARNEDGGREFVTGNGRDEPKLPSTAPWHQPSLTLLEERKLLYHSPQVQVLPMTRGDSLRLLFNDCFHP